MNRNTQQEEDNHDMIQSLADHHKEILNLH